MTGASRWLIRVLRRAPVFLAVGFLDELASALPSAGAPDVHASFSGPYVGLAAALLAIPMVSAIVLEAPLLALSDRWPKRHLALAAALAAMAGAYAGAAVSPSLFGVTLALAVAFPATGVAGALAEATLIAACRSALDRSRAMSRWTLAGAVGDTAGPIALALALGWRTGAAIIGAAIALVALVIVVVRPKTRAAHTDQDPHEEHEEHQEHEEHDAHEEQQERDGHDRQELAERAKDEAGPHDEALAEEMTGRGALLRAVRHALRDRRLVGWLVATALCGLLDETLIAFAALHWDALAEAGGYGRLTLGSMLAAFSLGAAVSLVIVDALLPRLGSGRVLGGAAVGCAVAYGAWLGVTGPVLGTAMFFAVGFCAAPLWPLCQARVYDVLPGRPGLANALSNVFSPVDVVMPLVLGVVADRAGVVVALALLVAQPLGVLALAFVDGRRRARS